MTTPATAPDRYARHLALPHVGVQGQERIRNGRVLVVGAGGLGSPALLYLAAAGVGQITVADDDLVSVSNLQRQVVHATADAGRPKVDSAAERLRALNPDVVVTALGTRIGASDAHALIAGFHVVVDGCDNFATRYALSDACAAAGIPYVYGSVQGWDGQAAVLCGRNAPCYRCMYPEPPPPGSVPACSDTGVLGSIPGIVGTIQATEALKLLTGAGQPLTGRLLLLDGLRMRFHEVALGRNPACTACGGTAARRRDITLNEATMDDNADYSPADLKGRLDAGDTVVVIDVREPAEWAIGHLGQARHIPVAEVKEAVGLLDPNAETVVYCHHGMRSATVADWLRRAGFKRVHNLAGGIDRWSLDVDPTIARY